MWGIPLWSSNELGYRHSKNASAQSFLVYSLRSKRTKRTSCFFLLPSAALLVVAEKPVFRKAKSTTKVLDFNSIQSFKHCIMVLYRRVETHCSELVGRIAVPATGVQGTWLPAQFCPHVYAQTRQETESHRSQIFTGSFTGFGAVLVN
uniref:N-alpha-acetyltransferase 40 n=1 Tax=Schistocephalus solidus TaxID=70667 RepID=A0A0X3P0I6_SCHSO